MAKKATKKSNVTKDRLAGTPFRSVAEMSAASDEILKDTWEQLERVRIKQQLLNRPEFRSFLDPFRKGVICRFEGSENLVRAHLTEDGVVSMDVNEELKSSADSTLLLGSLISGTGDSFFSNYLKSMGIIRKENDLLDDVDLVGSAKKKKT